MSTIESKLSRFVMPNDMSIPIGLRSSRRKAEQLDFTRCWFRAGKIWEQLLHTCFSFNATTSASFVAITLVVGCICIALLSFSEVTINASFRDPAAIAVTLVVSVAASS